MPGSNAGPRPRLFALMYVTSFSTDQIMMLGWLRLARTQAQIWSVILSRKARR